MSDCIFCRIAKQEIPATVVYEDESVIAFKDLSPQAPVHILIIPKKHVASLMEERAEDSQTLPHIMGEVVPKLANEQQLSAGFRVVINTGEEGGQTVNHLHFHLLGGRSMQWPPG